MKRFLFLAAALSLVPSVALAGNSDETLIGNDAALMAGAQTASVNTGAALYYNPAGLAFAPDNSVDVSMSAYSLRIHSVSSLVASPNGSEDGTSTEISIIPSGVSYARAINEKLVFGFGIFTLQQSDVTFDGAASADDGVQQVDYQLRVRRSDTLYKGSVGLGWLARPHFSMGFTVDLYYGSFTSSFLDDMVRTDIASGAVMAGETRVQTDSYDNFALGASFGMRFRLAEHGSIGLNIISPGMAFGSSVDRVENWTYFPGDGAAGCTPSNSACQQSLRYEAFETDFELMTPLRIRFGFAWVGPHGRFETDFDVQTGADDIGGRERSTVWNVRVGGIKVLSEVFSIGAGFFTDRSPFESPVILGDRQQDFYGGTVGLLIHKTLRLAEDEESEDLVFTTSIGFRYAYGTGQTRGVFVDENQQPGGLYNTFLTDLTSHEMAVNLGSGVSF